MRRLAVVLAAVVLVSGCSQKRVTPAAELRNEAAALSEGLPYPVLSWRPLTSGVDRGALTTFTLFGNAAAVTAAEGPIAGKGYPDGAVLGLVMWRQHEDAHWFGGRIPDVPLRVEFVSFAGGKATLRNFVGKPLEEMPVGETDAARAAEIAAMKPVWRP